MYVFIGIAAVSAVYFIFIYNRFIRYRAMMREAYSGIDVQLKRRHDLVPSIVESVKGYAKHEKGIFENVAALRTSLTASLGEKEKGELENGLSSAFKSIFALAEAYPDLKADKNFLNLQKTLVEIEDQLQMARRYYNGTVRNYNILAESFPSNLIARTFDFKKGDYFEIEYATERKVPDAKF